MAFIHSLFTFIGDTNLSGQGPAGNRVGCSLLQLDKGQTSWTEFAVAMTLNRLFRLQTFLFCLGLLCLPGTGAAQHKDTPKASPKYPAPPPEFFESSTSMPASTIAAGDVLSIRFFYTPELDKTVKVRDDGKISLDLFQGITVAGQTADELQKQLIALYSKEFTNPEVTVDIDSRANASAYVTGEVLLPGAKEVRGKTTVGMLLAMSQVNQRTAGIKSVFLMRNTGEHKYNVYQLDASFPDGIGHGVQIFAGDILFVPRKGIIKADDFIQRYVKDLLPATFTLFYPLP
jgi:polysaccharide export outer membrane protein